MIGTRLPNPSREARASTEVSSTNSERVTLQHTHLERELLENSNLNKVVCRVKAHHRPQTTSLESKLRT